MPHQPHHGVPEEYLAGYAEPLCRFGCPLSHGLQICTLPQILCRDIILIIACQYDWLIVLKARNDKENERKHC